MATNITHEQISKAIYDLNRLQVELGSLEQLSEDILDELWTAPGQVLQRIPEPKDVACLRGLETLELVQKCPERGQWMLTDLGFVVVKHLRGW